jgi:hypothetical protein
MVELAEVAQELAAPGRLVESHLRPSAMFQARNQTNSIVVRCWRAEEEYLASSRY